LNDETGGLKIFLPEQTKAEMAALFRDAATDAPKLFIPTSVR
jgi:hypothetical protein